MPARTKAMSTGSGRRRSARWSASNVPTGRHHGAPKHGDALLAGLLRCRRCGRKLTSSYTGAKHDIPRYACSRGLDRQWRAALHRLRRSAGRRRDRGGAADGRRSRRDRGGHGRREGGGPAAGPGARGPRRAISKRRATPPIAPSGSTTPPIRPTAWSRANWRRAGTGRLTRAAEVEAKIAAHDAAMPARRRRCHLCARSAGTNLKTVWSAPTTDARLKKRIVRTVIQEVIADIDDDAAEIVLVVHWVGGVHTEMRLPKRRRGQRNSTSADVIAAVRQLVLIANDDLIAGILNRNGLKTRPWQPMDPRACDVAALALSHPGVQARRGRDRAMAQPEQRR